MQFDEVKTETLNLRVGPSFKSALRVLAGTEHRSMVNMLEVLLADYCQRKGIKAIDNSEAQAEPTLGTKSRTSRRVAA